MGKVQLCAGLKDLIRTLGHTYPPDPQTNHPLMTGNNTKLWLPYNLSSLLIDTDKIMLQNIIAKKTKKTESNNALCFN